MKTVLAIAVITCLFVMGLAQNEQCASRASEVSNCISMSSVSSDDDVERFCDECGNKLVNYYRECADGVGVDAVQNSKL